jgi:FtsZ-binding cell division protein ZapB
VSEFFDLRPPETAKVHSVITIEHTTATSPTSKSAAFLLECLKPVFAVVAFVLLFTTISAMFFLLNSSDSGPDNQIAALTSQVDKLEAEVQLQTEIDRLTSEVDRLELEVDDLSLENDRLVVSNDRLEAQNSAFSDFVQQLNGTNIDIENWIQTSPIQLPVFPCKLPD